MIQNFLRKQGSTFSKWKSNRFNEEKKKKSCFENLIPHPWQATDPIGQSHIEKL